jgi:hypothetical protein
LGSVPENVVGKTPQIHWLSLFCGNGMKWPLWGVFHFQTNPFSMNWFKVKGHFTVENG